MDFPLTDSVSRPCPDPLFTPQTPKAVSTRGGSSTATVTGTSAADTPGRTPRRTAGSTAATWPASTARPSRTSSKVRRGETQRHGQRMVWTGFLLSEVISQSHVTFQNRCLLFSSILRDKQAAMNSNNGDDLFSTIHLCPQPSACCFHWTLIDVLSSSLLLPYSAMAPRVGP